MTEFCSEMVTYTNIEMKIFGDHGQRMNFYALAHNNNGHHTAAIVTINFLRKG